jgi:hypothetical protein
MPALFPIPKRGPAAPPFESLTLSQNTIAGRHAPGSLFCREGGNTHYSDFARGELARPALAKPTVSRTSSTGKLQFSRPLSCSNPSLSLFTSFTAERAGFEPAVRYYPYNTLAVCRFRPLSHLSLSLKYFIP